MKDCQDMRAQLSAYVDGELTPAERAEVDAHLASCPNCEQEVAELKTLAAGLAALPQLRPAPRFLAEVRRKIACDDNPEPPTWQDRLFRPLWLKVPLELAAIIAIVGYVMKSEEPMPVERGAGLEATKTENRSVEQERAESAARAKPTAAEPASALTALAGASRESPPATHAESLGTQITVDNQKTAVLATENLKLQDRSRTVRLTGSSGGLTMPSGPSAVYGGTALAATLGIEPSKLSGVVMVYNKKLSDVRSQAELLAAKCNGKVFPDPQPEDATGQVFFVEVPREYASAVRSELLQEPPPSALANHANIHAESGIVTETVATATSAVRAVGSVLVGRRETNETFTEYYRLDLAHDKKAIEPATVVLEILVVPPSK
jgi:hypothetical protein